MRSPLITITIALAIILTIIGGFAIISDQGQSVFLELKKINTNLEERVRTLETRLAILLENNESLSEKILEEEARRDALEEQFGVLEAGEATAIVSRWEDFVYDISCSFIIVGLSETRENGGSAIIELHNGSPRFITNSHVLKKLTAEPSSCTLTKPKDSSATITVSGNNIEVSDDIDIGYGTISKSVPAISGEKICRETPEIGDRVVILGYPGIGATDSITATEGIVSGFEDEYYLTSAKIDKGNSGGAAIHVKNDCLLGLPTLSVAGQVESLARILPVE